MSELLLPCPFCGGKALVETFPCDDLIDDFAEPGSGVKIARACVCSSCGAQSDPKPQHEAGAAEDAWNRRAPQQPREQEAPEVQPSAGWKCGARSGNYGATTPDDCNWPVCGCDPYADKVIDALQESGHMPSPSKGELLERVAELERQLAGAQAAERAAMSLLLEKK